MSDETPPEVPPNEIPDEGMSTASEEWQAKPESDPKTADDFGMSAGYPIISDDAIPMDPGAPPDEIEPPPEEAMSGAPLFSEIALKLPSPMPDIESKPPSQKEALPADPEMVKLLILDEDVKTLWQRAEQARKDVNQDINTLPIARQMLDLVQAGQNEILAGRDHYEEAERFVNEVEYRVGLMRLVKTWTKSYAQPLFGYLMVCGAAFLLILALVLGKVAFADGAQLETYKLEPDVVYLFASMVWGGFGGVLGAMFSLLQHTAQDQDFDKQHTLWYIGSPWIGAVVGAAVYLLLRTGLLSLMDATTDIKSPIIIYAIALLSGYRHNVFTDLVRRILNTFRVEEPQEEVPPPKPRTDEETPDTPEEDAS